MNARTRSAGVASAEYLALVAAVISLFVGLLVLKPQTVSRRPPVDVISPIAKLLAAPVTPTTTRSVTPTPRRPRGSVRPRPKPTNPTVMLPEWWSR